MGQRLTGVQRYAREIVAVLAVLLEESPDAAARLSATLALPPGAPAPDFVPAGGALSLTRTSRGGGHVWDQFVLPFVAPNILSLGNSGPLMARRHILCIHDLNVYLAPDSYSRNYRRLHGALLPVSARRASLIVTVSRFSAKLIAERGLCPAAKVSVIPNGSDHALRWRADRADRTVLDSLRRPYVLVIGSNARHKNIAMILGLAADLGRLGIDIALVGGSDKVFSAVGAGLEAAVNVRRLGGVDDDTLAALLGGALCLAFPSFVEGFGLPIVEAMALGCPVVSSNTTSMPEVGGDAVLYAAPDAPGDWLAAIARLAVDEGLRADLSARGRRQAQRFLWRDSGEKYLDLLLADAQSR